VRQFIAVITNVSHQCYFFYYILHMIDCSLLYDSDARIAAIVYFSFIFVENARENLWAAKGMG
jgi:hypothetical protein